jgi:hypothetical protein
MYRYPPNEKWGPALLPAPTAPSEGSAGIRNLVDITFRPTNPLSILAHQLRRRFPSCHSLLRGAGQIYSTTWPEGSLVVRPDWPAGTSIRRPNFRAKTARCSAALLGMNPLVSRFAHQGSEEPREPRRTTGRTSLPAPLPDWPRKEPESSLHCLPAEIGPLVACRTLPCRCRPFRGGRDRRPDHLVTMHMRSESGK